jgi:3'(2'), 5'-bisphosphate nucleotidase
MLDMNSPEIAFAVQCVRQASQLVRQVQAEMVSPALTKADRSPVTVADFASQALVAHLLEETFPEEPLVAEEDSASLKEPGAEKTLDLVTGYVSRVLGAGSREQVCEWIDRGRVEEARRFWTLDPIDGTKGFLRGDQYAVALALIQDGQVLVGVLGCPNLVAGQTPDLNGSGSLVIAARGQGTWTTSLAEPSLTRLQVSVTEPPRRVASLI